MAFDERSYRDGVWVGQIIGALVNGCHSMASTWPESALPEHREQVEEWAKFYGLKATFDEKGLLIEKREPPTLTVVK